MFAAITDQDGVLHPTQYVGGGPFIRLWDSNIVTPAELQDNPEMYFKLTHYPHLHCFVIAGNTCI